ncbi:MAG TPA: 2-oxo acid dehydrogenase subunit E2, partial [Alphaproteobacteria bacterium]|nr:2-oxo acid dehydrogenase subunit E2 [Alphaproteobacteria bacterium]
MTETSFTVSVPQINKDDTRVEIVAWHIKPGAKVEAGKPVVDLETAKTLITVDAERAGFIKPLAEKGAVIKAGDPLYLCAPTLDELEKSSASIQKLAAPAASTPQAARHERLSLAKQAEVAALTQGESGNINSRHSIFFNSASIRERLMADQALGGNIQPLILYEIAQLLKSNPQFTSYFSDNAVHYYDRVDLGVAFDLGKGLKVTTIREADQLKPIDFAKKTLDIGMRYLRNALTQEDLSGSTLTVTDVSGLNILHFHPLINGHQSAIIGIGGDAAQPNHPMAIHITFDHRVMSGREVGTFLGELRTRILSYAPAEELSPAQSEPSFYPQMDTAQIRCDRCAIELSAYYKRFKRDAYMMPYFREDGSM